MCCQEVSCTNTILFYSCCWGVSDIFLTAFPALLSPCRWSCMTDQKRSLWTRLRESSADPSLTLLQQANCHFQRSSWDPTDGREKKEKERDACWQTPCYMGRLLSFHTSPLHLPWDQCNLRDITPAWPNARGVNLQISLWILHHSVCHSLNPVGLPQSMLLLVIHYSLYSNLPVNEWRRGHRPNTDSFLHWMHILLLAMCKNNCTNPLQLQVCAERHIEL